MSSVDDITSNLPTAARPSLLPSACLEALHAAGDAFEKQAAYSRLLRNVHRFLVRAALDGRPVSLDTAIDAATDRFLAVASRLTTGVTAAPLVSSHVDRYVARTALNRVIDAHRAAAKRARFFVSCDVDTFASPTLTPEDELLARETKRCRHRLRHRLATALQSLRPIDRDALIAVHLQGHGVDTLVAEYMHLNHLPTDSATQARARNVIDKRLQRARSRLRQALESAG